MNVHRTPFSRRTLLAGLAGASFVARMALPQRASARIEVPVLPMAMAPEMTAKAAFAIDVSAGVELLAKNPDERLPPASTVKMMTAIVAVETVSIEDVVVFSGADVSAAGESTAGLLDGDELTVADLLYAALVQSGGDSARALARYAGAALLRNEGADGDPIARFVQEMNTYGSNRLGLQNTLFTNPSGIGEDGMYSSARDLATIARDLLRGRKFLSNVVATQSHVLAIGGPNAREVRLVNTNRLLGERENVHGVKTGSSASGASLVLATWHRGDNRVIEVVLESSIQYDAAGYQIPETDMRYPDMGLMLDTLDASYEWIDPTNGDVPGLLDELAAWDVRLGDRSSIVVPRTIEGPLSYVVELLPESATESVLGRVLFFVGSQPIAERSVEAIA